MKLVRGGMRPLDQRKDNDLSSMNKNGTTNVNDNEDGSYMGMLRLTDGGRVRNQEPNLEESGQEVRNDKNKTLCVDIYK